ncbi:hypothetical protein LZ30DRAFT_720399 [Colletotrichum cereale]|nr:hypothetical protein LZ30DRAFT_720399 [Colletotrichum cereale]
MTTAQFQSALFPRQMSILFQGPCPLFRTGWLILVAFLSAQHTTAGFTRQRLISTNRPGITTVKEEPPALEDSHPTTNTQHTADCLGRSITKCCPYQY